MACEFCRGVGGYHYKQCPNYNPSKSNHNCIECEENILIGEEYIVNDNGDYTHWECVSYGRDLVKFLGYEIKEMEDENY